MRLIKHGRWLAAAVALGLAALTAGPALALQDQCIFSLENSGLNPKNGGAIYQNAAGRSVPVLSSDTALASSDGSTLAVWSADHVLRSFAGTAYDGTLGATGQNSIIPYQDAQSGAAYQYGLCTQRLPAAAGVYGQIGDQPAVPTAQYGVMYNPVSVGGTSGGYDIAAAWSSVSGAVGKPDPGSLYSAFNNYVSSGYFVNKLPTVSVTWQSDNYFKSSNQSFTFTMLDGSKTRFCDPAKIKADPMLARAPYVFNGIYCSSLSAVATSNPTGSNYNDPTTQTPITVGTTSSPATPLGANQARAITESNTQLNMNLGVASTRSPDLGGCADLTSTPGTSSACR